MENIKERYIATVVLHALGDTIGFRNGIWEFNYNIPITKPPHHGLSELILHDFIDLGGINDINLNYKTFEEIISGKIYQEYFPKSLNSKPHPICIETCSDKGILNHKETEYSEVEPEPKVPDEPTT